MKTYDNYFDVKRHLENDVNESFTWKGVTRDFVEILEIAEEKGYKYKLECYDDYYEFRGERHKMHHRDMIFVKE